MKLFFCALITAALLGVTGCTTADSDRARYNRIADDLDTGGSCYLISTTSSLGGSMTRLLKEGERFTWGTSFAPETQFKLQRFISHTELLLRKAGVHELKGWGASSRQLPGKEIAYRNKFRLLLPAAPKGALWNILAKENKPLEKELYDLPDDTYFAGAFHLSPESLLRLIDSDKQLSATVTDVCKTLLGKSPAEAAKDLSGVWKIVLVCDEENDISSLTGIHLALSVPDRGNRIFNILSSRLKFIPDTTVNETTVKLAPFPGKMCIPYAVRGIDKLTICTSPRAFLRTSRLNSFPRLPACIKKISHRPELYGTAVFYSRDLTGFTPARSIDLSRVRPALGVVRQLSDGFLMEESASLDLNSYALLSMAAYPLYHAFDLLTAPVQKPEKSAVSPAPRSAAPARPVVRQSTKSAPSGPRKNDCTSHIAKAGKALLGAVAKNKSWPAPGIPGLRGLAEKKLLAPALLKCPAVKSQAPAAPGLSYGNCHYIYTGKPGKNSPKTPVLIEIPFLHKDHFSVFYADGSVEEIKLSGRRNVRRAVSYLHTIHSYEEEEFIRLIQFATELDKILEH